MTESLYAIEQDQTKDVCTCTHVAAMHFGPDGACASYQPGAKVRSCKCKAFDPELADA